MKEEKCKRPLDINYEQLLSTEDGDEYDPLRDFVIVRGKSSEAEMDCTATGIQQLGKGVSSINGEGQIHQQVDEIERMSDARLDDVICQKNRSINAIGYKLPDKGAKLRITLKLLEDERERRRLRLSQSDCDRPEMVPQSENPDFIGTSGCSKQYVPTHRVQRETSFASAFSKNLDEKFCNHRDPKAFHKEISYLGNYGRQEAESTEFSSTIARRRTRLSTKDTLLKCAPSFSCNTDNSVALNDDENDRDCCSSHDRYINDFARRNPAKDANAVDLRLRKAQKVILVDEEESAHRKTILQSKVSDCMKDTQIYYPSRDDPDSVYIGYSDIECLAPEAFLSSTVMNFYIRYLQQLASTAGRVQCEYQFFNTYFYKKLREALSHKGDKQMAFSKFRRWWKGINIFQRAYILIPIHDELHWSLIIICIPAEEEELGPVILHLDSLRFHCSKSIFWSIRSFLREEWNFLGRASGCTDVTIRDGIWKHLPGHIHEKRIPVPQQTNEYDCGLFVLFFMERFIQEAPERLKRDDLAKFGKEWFRPEEASGLRVKIKKLLIEEFHKSNDHKCISDCSPTSSDSVPNERTSRVAHL